MMIVGAAVVDEIQRASSVVCVMKGEKCEEGRRKKKKKTFLTVEIGKLPREGRCVRACVSGSHAEKMNNGEEGTE